MRNEEKNDISEKICHYWSNWFLLYIIFPAIIFQGNTSNASEQSKNSYLIKTNGIEYLIGGQITYASARAFYPDAEINLELGHPGTLWRKNIKDYSEKYYFVFRQNGIEMFRAECFCTPSGMHDWTPDYLPKAEDKTHIKINPVAIDPKFQT